jgi:hypothetical protein
LIIKALQIYSIKMLEIVKKTCCQTLGDSRIVRLNAPFLVWKVNGFHLETSQTNKPNNRRRNMKVEKWTLGLAASGLISLSPALLAQTAAPAPSPLGQQTPVLTALSATTISGYVDTSAVWNPGTGNANPAPYAFNAGKQDGFNLDSVDIKIARPLQETGWSAGYTAEISYGPDAKAIDAGAYPIRQAYVELNMPVGNGIDWKLGRIDDILGYESSDSYKNPNFTRSYGKTVEPTELTGLLASYKFCDAFSAQLGVADTVETDPFSANARIGAESKKAYVGAATLTAPDSWGSFKGSTLYAGYEWGQGAQNAPDAAATPIGAQARRELYVGTTINTPIKDFTVGFAYDNVEHLDGYYAGIDRDAGFFASYAGYASYKLTDKLTLNGRFEYADGASLGYLADAANGIPATTIGGVAGVAVPNPMNKVLAATGTLQYDLWENVVSRLEVRWDHDASGRESTDGSSAAFGGTGAGAVPDKLNEIMIAANVIYKF